MNRREFLSVAASAAVGLTGCASSNEASPLRAAAAADLDPALREIVAQFERERGIAARVTFGSTGAIARQIEHGAPIDLFLAADAPFIAQLVEKKLADAASVAEYGRGKIVIWQREDAPVVIREATDLASAAVRRIAIANPEHAPYGRAAKEFLVNAGVWAAVEKKLAFGENVGEALQFARTGDADAAIVARAQVFGADGRQCAVAETLYAPLRQTLAVVSATKRPEDARALAQYVVGESGRAVLRRFGFE
jgi:molybdate transport system substrate-binding protein